MRVVFFVCLGVVFASMCSACSRGSKRGNSVIDSGTGVHESDGQIVHVDSGTRDAGNGTPMDGAMSTGSDGAMSTGSDGAMSTGSDGAMSTGSDGASSDAASVVYHYNCGAFSTAVGWTVLAGYRAVVVADSAAGLSAPVALAFAEGAYGGKLFVVNAGDSTLKRVDVLTGAVTTFTSGAQWGSTAPVLLTTITWDAQNLFDGEVYVGDQGSDADGDSVLYRVAPDGSASVFARAPGAGFDDIYALTFSPRGSEYTAGLYVTGDTDGAGVSWGIVAASGTISDFSSVLGTEGAAFDPTGSYGGSLWASRPGAGGYAGDSTITPMTTSGAAGTPLVTGQVGVHAVTFSQRGAFGARMYAADWATGELFSIAPDGTKTTLASGLSLTNYDGNILAASSDGQVLFVADRSANRIVCIEPVAGATG